MTPHPLLSRRASRALGWLCGLGLTASISARAADGGAAPPPAPAPDVGTASTRPDDREVQENLRLLMDLDMLQDLELFKAPGSADGGSPPPASGK